MAAHALTFGNDTTFSAAIALTVAGSLALTISPTTSFEAVANLSVSQASSLGFTASTAFESLAELAVSHSQALGFTASTAFESGADLMVGHGVPLAFSAITAFSGSAALSGVSNSMTLCDVTDEVLGMWGIFSRCSAPSFAIERAVNDINSALQLVWNNADERDYWSNSTLTVTLADGESSQNLADDIQNVVGPCRLADTRRPLAPLENIGDLETFSDIYLDGETANAPMAYHIERMNQAGADPAKCVFHVVPAVIGSTGFLLEVVKEAPRFTAGDLTACPLIPIPHRYVETLLLPVARYLASSYYLFRQTAQKEAIAAEYLQAQISLGLADPSPAANKEVEK